MDTSRTRPQLSEWIQHQDNNYCCFSAERQDSNGDTFLEVTRRHGSVTVLFVPQYGRGIIRRVIPHVGIPPLNFMMKKADSVWNEWKGKKHD
jgi:hypothetical protein